MPSDEPSCCPVNWRPPASLRPDASTDDWTTLPSWDARSPMPRPKAPIAIAKPRSFNSGSIVARRMTEARPVITRPALTIDRTENRPDRRAPAAAARNIITDTGSILIPVSRASRPSTICRYSGTVKKMPIRIRFCESNPISPDRTGGISNRSRCTSGSVPDASRCRCQRTNAHSSTPPAAITKNVSENPNGSTGESFGFSQPQVLAWSVPRTIAPSPTAERIAPVRSKRGLAPSRIASWTKGLIARMPRTMTTSPTNTTRQLSSVVAQPPRMGPIAMPAPATPPMIP